MINHDKMHVEKSTVYCLNKAGTNKWSFHVQPGHDDYGNRTHVTHLDQLAHQLSFNNELVTLAQDLVKQQMSGQVDTVKLATRALEILNEIDKVSVSIDIVATPEERDDPVAFIKKAVRVEQWPEWAVCADISTAGKVVFTKIYGNGYSKEDVYG